MCFLRAEDVFLCINEFQIPTGHYEILMICVSLVPTLKRSVLKQILGSTDSLFVSLCFLMLQLLPK